MIQQSLLATGIAKLYVINMNGYMQAVYPRSFESVKNTSVFLCFIAWQSLAILFALFVISLVISKQYVHAAIIYMDRKLSCMNVFIGKLELSGYDMNTYVNRFLKPHLTTCCEVLVTLSQIYEFVRESIS